MNAQQVNYQPAPNKLFSGTSSGSGDKNREGSGSTHKVCQISHYLENADHFYDDDVGYHHRYF